MSTSRVEAFSDGVFAVAITLLVFNIVVPEVHPGHLRRALLDLWPSYAAYAVSFATIGIIWVNHHATFTRIARVDRPLLFINLLLLMTISFIPFPTNVLSRYIQSGSDAKIAAFVYACTMTAMSIAFSGIWTYALQRGLLEAQPTDKQRRRSSILRFGAGLFVYGIAIVVALINPVVDLVLLAAIAVFYIFDQQAAVDVDPE